MRRLLPVLLALTATPVAPTPAVALPPAVVVGYGTITPHMFLTPVDPFDVFFVGTATPVVGSPYSCTFSARGWNYVPGTLTGFASTTSCGPGVDFNGCPFELTPATFTVTCPTTSLVTHAAYTGIQLTPSFTATGVLV